MKVERRVIKYLIFKQKNKKYFCFQKFKRLRRIQDEESEGEDDNDAEQEREHIAMDLFSEDVSNHTYQVIIKFCLEDLFKILLY